MFVSRKVHYSCYPKFIFYEWSTSQIVKQNFEAFVSKTCLGMVQIILVFDITE